MEEDMKECLRKGVGERKGVIVFIRVTKIHSVKQDNGFIPLPPPTFNLTSLFRLNCFCSQILFGIFFPQLESISYLWQSVCLRTQTINGSFDRAQGGRCVREACRP